MKTSTAAGFDAAMRAAEMLDGQTLSVEHLVPLAPRLADNTHELRDTAEPDLSSYDRFLTS